MVCGVGVISCGGTPADWTEIKDGQRKILAKLDDLEKKIQAVGSRPAGPPPADPNRVYNIPSSGSPYKGPSDAPVMLAEFSDFQCPFCSKVTPLIEEMLQAFPKELKVVFKQLPLPMHKDAMNAARASLAAHKQGKFWEMHDKMFGNQRALDIDSLKRYAGQIGLDVAKFEVDLAAKDVQAQIDEDMKLAQASQVNGTPTLFLNGKRVTDRSPDGLKRMIAEALKK